MLATEDSQLKYITLASRPWPVPLLSARQNKIIDPIIIRLLPLFTEWQQDKAQALARLGEQHYTDLQEIAFQAIRHNSSLSRENFDELPISLPELIASINVIAEQTGLFARGEEGDTPPGEQ